MHDLQQTAFIGTQDQGPKLKKVQGQCVLRALGFIWEGEGGVERQDPMDMGRNGAKEESRVGSANRETGVE